MRSSTRRSSTATCPPAPRLRIRDLAEQVGTSVMPVREAIRSPRRRLVWARARTPQGGCRERADALRSCVHVHDVRRLLEGEAARRAPADNCLTTLYAASGNPVLGQHDSGRSGNAVARTRSWALRERWPPSGADCSGVTRRTWSLPRASRWRRRAVGVRCLPRNATQRIRALPGRTEERMETRQRLCSKVSPLARRGPDRAALRPEGTVVDRYADAPGDASRNRAVVSGA